MVISGLKLYVEDVTEKEFTKKDGSKGTFFSAKVSTGDAFDYPMWLLVNKKVVSGCYSCAMKLGYDKDKNKNTISVSIGDAISD